MSTVPSGRQFEIRHGDQRASIVEVGGGIRQYEVAGRPVLDPYPLDKMSDGAHGAVLVPWPNRLADGRYRFDGIDYQLALTEPSKQNAIHGLLRWRSWEPLQVSPSGVTLTATVHPMPGYPFCLVTTVDYQLDDDGLSVTTAASNAGARALPYGSGHHPYLSPGSGLVDACSLRLDAKTRVLTDDQRQLPIGTEPVAGTAFDLTAGRMLGDQQVDHAFTDLARDLDGWAWVRMSCPDGQDVELWVDEQYRYIQIYTGDTLRPNRRRCGLAVEPMTCPPNALQSGHNVIRIEPGESVTTRWGVRLRSSPLRPQPQR